MPKSTVYFTSLRAGYNKNLLTKISSLLDNLDMGRDLSPGNLVAVKMHFGEKGNIAFIRPNYIRQIIDYVGRIKADVFLTDTNTLYSGSRSNSVSHIKTAIENGFAYPVVNAPIIIADGIRGGSFQKINIKKEIFEDAYIGAEIYRADALIGVAHFKGHEVSGFGGAIKNLGMGCASRKGKLLQHSGLAPKVIKKRCTGCGECIKSCSFNAISLKENKAFINPEVCAGCGECIVVCVNKAVNIRWNTDRSLFQKKIAEYAFAALKNKNGKAFFLNFLMDISPSCDCPPYNDAPIVADLGIMASRDPVAIDQASVDMVNRQPSLNNSCLRSDAVINNDIFRSLYPDIDWSVQLEHAEKIGLGSRKYNLVEN